MQQFFSLVLFFLLFSQFLGQAQTISYAEETGTLEEQKLVDAKNCFFKNQESVSHIWKMNVVDFLNTEVDFISPIIGAETGLGIGYEKRLTTGWSLNFALNGSLLKGQLNDKQSSSLSAFSNVNTTVLGVAFSIEPRWYVKKKKQVAQKLSGDNLSGMYLGLQFGLDIEKSNVNFTLTPNNTISGLEGFTEIGSEITNRLFIQTVNVGLQQQFSKNGYFDIKVGAGLQRNQEIINSLDIDGQLIPSQSVTTWKTILNYQLGLGFVIGNNEPKTEIPNCQVFEYHEDAKRLLKLSVINPTNLLSSEGIQSIITAGIEQKIGASPLSLNANIIFDASPGRINRFSFELEPRYYYDLKKRQLAGKTGNSFSANYIGLRSELLFDRRLGIAPVWGLQRQFFKRFLFDFSAGPERVYDFLTERNGWSFFSELRIGVAF